MIGKALKLLRLYAGLSQNEVARKLGVAQSLISGVESEKVDVSMALLNSYSNAFNIRRSQLLFFAEEIEGEPIHGKGHLLVADRVLKILDGVSPKEKASAR